MDFFEEKFEVDYCKNQAKRDYDTFANRPDRVELTRWSPETTLKFKKYHIMMLIKQSVLKGKKSLILKFLDRDPRDTKDVIEIDKIHEMFGKLGYRISYALAVLHISWVD